MLKRCRNHYTAPALRIAYRRIADIFWNAVKRNLSESRFTRNCRWNAISHSLIWAVLRSKTDIIHLLRYQFRVRMCDYISLSVNHHRIAGIADWNLTDNIREYIHVNCYTKHCSQQPIYIVWNYRHGNVHNDLTRLFVEIRLTDNRFIGFYYLTICRIIRPVERVVVKSLTVPVRHIDLDIHRIISCNRNTFWTYPRYICNVRKIGVGRDLRYCVYNRFKLIWNSIRCGMRYLVHLIHKRLLKICIAQQYIDYADKHKRTAHRKTHPPEYSAGKRFPFLMFIFNVLRNHFSPVIYILVLLHSATSHKG